MYATIRVYRVKGDKSKELDQIVTEDFLPIVSHLPGYVAYFAIDQGSARVPVVREVADREWAGYHDRRHRCRRPEQVRRCRP